MLRSRRLFKPMAFQKHTAPQFAVSRRLFLRGLLRSLALRRFSRFAYAADLLFMPLRRSQPPPAELSGSTPPGSRSEKYLPETTGAGCAFLDYDNDGWMDIYSGEQREM